MLSFIFDHGANKSLYKPETSASVPSREDIPEKYKWNLTLIYSSDDAWEADFGYIEKNYAKIKDFEGKVTESPEGLHRLLVFDQELGIKVEKLYLYAMLAKDSDLRDTRYQAMDTRIKSLYTKVSTASSFIRPELMQTDESVIKKFCQDFEPLSIYSHFFDELFRSKKHTLSKELEELLASSGEIAGVPYDTFSVFTNAEMPFGTVADEDGTEVQMSHGRYQAALYASDRSYRERAFKTYYKPYCDFSNTLASLFNGNLKAKIFNAKARNYISAREASLDRNNIPVRVYDNLIQTASRNLQPMHRWMALKKKLLGIDELHPYDVYTGIFSKQNEKHFGFEEAFELVKKSLVKLGPDYAEMLEDTVRERRIDVMENKGKRSGAYSSGTTFGVNPYVLLNWSSLLNDVFTLTHELGHNVHSFLTGNHQPYIYADYSIFLAEIASTFNESLLLDYLAENSVDVAEKRMYLERYLNNASATFYRQIMFAEFEMLVYNKAESGEALTPDALCSLYQSMYQKYMGPDMVIDTEESYTWARVPHFYYNFYVFQYATGFAASESLAMQVQQGGDEVVLRYLNFLKAGKSDYPLEILKRAGVDMTSPDAINGVVTRMNNVLDELEKSLP